MVRLALALVGCGGDAAEPTDGSSVTEPVDLGAPGPWPAGTTTRTITGSDGQPLVVQYWYPATEAGDFPVTYDGLLAGEAFEDVPADCAEAHPLLAFSHGYGGTRYQSPFFTERLATHGWVVVAPDHRGNTFLDDSGDLAELVVRRPVDVSDAVDAVLAEPALAGCTDEALGYAVAGHSFGGYTALAVAGATVNLPTGGTGDLGDPRAWAALGFAPWDGFGAITDGTAAIEVPTMLLTGERDDTVPIAQVRSLYAPLTVEPRRMGVFPEAGHYSFSPVACLLYTGDGCGDDYVDLDVFTELVDQASLAFLGEVLGQPGAADQIPPDQDDLHWE